MNNMLGKYIQLVLVIVAFCFAMYGCEKSTMEKSARITAVNENVVDETAVVENVMNESAVVVESINEISMSMASKKEPHQAHSLVKPGAAVKLKTLEPLYVTTPGVYEHSLVLVSPSHTGKMTIDVSTSDGVVIVSPERHFEFELQTDSEYEVPLILSISTNGRYYVHMQVTIETEDVSATRVISAILQVGESVVKTQKAAAASVAKDTEAVISLPAQETISPR